MEQGAGILDEATMNDLMEQLADLELMLDLGLIDNTAYCLIKADIMEVINHATHNQTTADQNTAG